MPGTSIPNFVGGSYKSPALSFDSEECINLYVENAEVPGAKEPVALFGAPGIAQFLECGNGPIRGLLDLEGFTSVVSGSGYYRINPDNSGNVTPVGDVGSDGLPVQMVANTQYVLIVSAGAAYVHSGAGLNPVVNPPWTRAVDCVFSNGYFIVLDDDGQALGGQFFISALNDATTWDPLDFTTSPSSNNKLRALSTTHNEVWVYGSIVTQPFYYNPAATDFPFIANQQVALEQGIENRDTRVNLDNTVFWLGRSSYGTMQAFAANGYLPQRISTYPIEAEWLTYERPTDCTAWAFQINGHLFYNLNFNFDQKSWRYDHATNLWHRIAYRNPITNIDECHRGNCYCTRILPSGLGVQMVGDRQNGKLWQISTQFYSDGPDPLVSLRRAPFPFQGNKRVFFPVFELITTPGIGNGVPNTPEFNPAWMFRWSNDNGNTWGPEFQLSLGQQGKYSTRQRKVNCGSGRNRVFEVSISAKVQRCIIGAELPEGVTVGTE